MAPRQTAAPLRARRDVLKSSALGVRCAPWGDLFGFSWKSDPLDTSKSGFAIMGEEVNGRYYNI